jgi:outer membrane immunogenic protein
MRKLLVGLGISSLMISSCYAADLAVMPTKAPAYAPVGSPFDGFYVGGNIGYGGGNFSGSAAGLSESQSGSGVVGGGQLGYNKTFGNWLLGLETDFQGSGISGGNNSNGIQSNLNWFGTTRVRTGFLVAPNWLLFASGGAAYGQAQLSAFGNQLQVNAPGVGWAAGVGTQYAFNQNWSVGLEYLHVDLSGLSANIGNLNLNSQVSSDIGRVRLDYKFW